MKILNRILSFMLLLILSAPLNADNSPIDDNIEDVIQSEITLDEDIDENNITVTSHNGIVQLEGQVASQDAKNEIIDIAKSAEGVVKVDASKLTVYPH